MLLVAVLAVLLSGFSVIFATIVMSYISLAVPIGPWIEPTILLVALVVTNLVLRRTLSSLRGTITGYATIAAGIAGITASACAWSIPALYFVQPSVFAQWLSQPWYFAAVYATAVIVAGGFGLLCARIATQWITTRQVLQTPALPFPLASMLERSILAADQLKKGYQLAAGAVITFVVSAVQTITRCIPDKLLLIPAIKTTYFELSPVVLHTAVLPMLWAIGFITGHLLAIPFAIGTLTKIFLIEPVRHVWFATANMDTFLLAFCAGLVVQGALASFFIVPSVAKLRKLWATIGTGVQSPLQHEKLQTFFTDVTTHVLEYVVVIGALLYGLWVLQLSVLAQIFVVIATGVCVYQLMLFMAQIGLAPLGRFATFVMLPGMVFFGFTPLQATMVAAGVEIAGGVAADAFSGKRFAQLLGLDERRVHWLQWAALVLCAATIGIVFWMFITQFGLGTEQLVAQKARARALLITAHEFDLSAVVLGFVFGFILKYFHIAASLVLGGLLMPVDWSLILVLSGLSTYLVKDKQAQYPVWSGVFAASSVWMLIRAILRW